MSTVALIGTFDTKGSEYLYVQGQLEALGLNTITINVGVFDPVFTPDVSSQIVAEAGGYDLSDIVHKHDRSLATKALAHGLQKLLPRLYTEGKFDAALSFGGSGGTALVTPAMRLLPLGIPKIMVSTMASGDVSRYVGTSDIVMMPSIVDVAGINRISKMVFDNAILAVYGMLAGKTLLPKHSLENKPLIAATMFGVTTPCITKAKSYLEDHGYEVIVFHATGTGGKTMERLIENGFFKGVLDITTTEWCDEVVGGILAAGPERNEAASLHGVPQVVSVGAMDMVNFGSRNTIQEKFKGRNFYQHNPDVTLMRTTIDENIEIGKRLSEKLNMATGKTALLLPLKGVSEIDADGKAFWGEREDKALFETLKENIHSEQVEITELNNHINDNEFALCAAKKLLSFIN